MDACVVPSAFHTVGAVPMGQIRRSKRHAIPWDGAGKAVSAVFFTFKVGIIRLFPRLGPLVTDTLFFEDCSQRLNADLGDNLCLDQVDLKWTLPHLIDS